ncbi:VanZ family protein [Nocardioides zhouii]|uniref:VanZ family protein n=1 Tax=Nocardioides zhouii TaxID=1168729 RepID=A0A4V1RN30_9ACTN|nr:VanZ family protein [Nocardioides zhouii]RYC04427.1 VanZ family protein [Nocardioides zhouii]
MRDRRWMVAAALSYVIGLAVLVVGPWGWELNRLTVRIYTLFRYDWRLTPDGIGPEHYGIALNVLLFVPLGAVLAALTRRPVLTLLVCLACSAFVEVSQARWLQREGGWTDIVANTVGALVGVALVSLATRARRRPAPR